MLKCRVIHLFLAIHYPQAKGYVSVLVHGREGDFADSGFATGIHRLRNIDCGNIAISTNDGAKGGIGRGGIAPVPVVRRRGVGVGLTPARHHQLERVA